MFDFFSKLIIQTKEPFECGNIRAQILFSRYPEGVSVGYCSGRRALSRSQVCETQPLIVAVAMLIELLPVVSSLGDSSIVFAVYGQATS